MASTYSKPYLSRQDQIVQLQKRGLTVNDVTSAEQWLRLLGYYRLSAYWYPFRQRKFQQAQNAKSITTTVLDDFEGGTTFEQAIELYLFDKKLRAMVSEAISQIEVAARVDIAHSLGKHDTFAQENAALLDGNFIKPPSPNNPSNHALWLTKLNDLVARSKEDFIEHNKSKYGLPLPIWVAIEVWDFGLLSHFCAGMKQADKIAMGTRFGVTRGITFTSWMRTLNYLRNLSAHHSRLWNRNIIDRPKLPMLGDIPIFDTHLKNLDISRPYASFCIIAYLLRQIDPNTTWPKEMRDLLLAFPIVKAGSKTIDVDDIGCPKNWKAHQFLV